jgi:AAA15 family ATPase/GTPase
MLIEFSVGNFRSFKERATLSMVAANTNARDPIVNKNNTIIVNDKLTLLTSTAIYGANASGKSNVVQALAFMRKFVLSSAKESQTGERIAVEPFRLSTETENEPSFFEIVFLINDIQYRYGFEVNLNQVISEWLFSVPSTKEATLFVREENTIKPSSKFLKEGKGLEEKTRSNALFLSVVAQFNGEISQSILKWFRRMGIVSGLDDMSYRAFTIQQVVEGKYKNEIIQLIKKLDIDINEIEGLKVDKTQVTLPANMPEELRALLLKNMQDEDWLTVQTKHPKLNAQGQLVGLVSFDMDQNESHGTQKAFYLAGPIIDVLTNGKVLIVDEMEARLHPLITRELIRLFNSIELNPKRAQLIFTTHDTNLLSNKIFRRDQIWFVEKDSFSASHLYSLAELKIHDSKVRNDASFEDDYLQGRYGAIPFLGGIKTIVLKREKSNDEK